MESRYDHLMYWKLGGPDGHTPVPATREEWGALMEHPTARQVGYDKLDNGVTVSTVFLGLDHGFGHSGQPILFETMTFGGVFSDEQDRYATWEQAERGHRRALILAQAANDLKIKEAPVGN